MPQRISAEQGAIRAGVTAVRSAQDDIDDQLVGAERNIVRAAEHWLGRSGARYATLMADLRGELARLTGALTSLENALVASERDLTSVEEENTVVIANLHAMMSGGS